MWNFIKATLIVSVISLFILLKWIILIPLGIIGAIWGGKRLLDENQRLEREFEEKIIEGQKDVREKH
jgi:hypothetical protein